MKIYETPKFEICRFETGDIMTNLSGGGGFDGAENEGPFLPATVDDKSVLAIEDNI